MSAGILAWINRDTAPVDDKSFQRLLDSMRHRGPDGCSVLSLESIALGEQNFFCSPNAVTCPHQLPDTGLCIAFDGRISHRAALIDELGLDGHRAVSVSDPELALEAYRQWGVRWIEHIRGGVAAVIFDPERNLLVASRDALGRYPLYYHLNDRLLLIASEPQAILWHPSVPPTLDQVWLADYFSLYAGSSRNRTPFAAIRALMPGETLEWTPDQARFYEYSPLFGQERLSYRTDAEYGEHFRELLSRSVDDLLRGEDTVGVMLSGGMDSCPVASLAAASVAETDRTPTAYCWRLPHFPESDETEQILICANHAGIPVNFFIADDIWMSRAIRDWPVSLNGPQANPYAELLGQTYTNASRDGCRALINPIFGDRLYPHPQHWLWEALIDGRLDVAAKGLLQLIKQRRTRGLLGNAEIRHLVKRVLRYPGRQRSAPQWLTPDAGSLLDLGEYSDNAARHPRADHYEQLLGPDVFRSQFGDTTSWDRLGIVRVEPYHDWDLIDFVLSIPAYQCSRPGQSKYVAREAMRGIIPEAIRTRPKGSLLHSLWSAGTETLFPAIREYLKEPGRNSWQGFVNPQTVTDILERRGVTPRLQLLPWQVFCFELWLSRLRDAGISAHLD